MILYIHSYIYIYCVYSGICATCIKKAGQTLCILTLLFFVKLCYIKCASRGRRTREDKKMKKNIKIYEVTTNSLRRCENEGFYTDRENAIYAAFSGENWAPDGVKYTLKMYTLPLPLPAPYTAVKTLLRDYEMNALECCSAADRYCTKFIEDEDGLTINVNIAVSIRNGLARAKARR